MILPTAIDVLDFKFFRKPVLFALTTLLETLMLLSCVAQTNIQLDNLLGFMFLAASTHSILTVSMLISLGLLIGMTKETGQFSTLRKGSFYALVVSVSPTAWSRIIQLVDLVNVNDLVTSDVWRQTLV